MKYHCIKECFHRGRLWALGETLEPTPGEKVPKHFSPEPAPVSKPEPEKPVPLSEITQKIAEEEELPENKLKEAKWDKERGETNKRVRSPRKRK